MSEAADVQTSQRYFNEAPLPGQQMMQETTERPSVKIKWLDFPKRTCKNCWERPREQLLPLCRADEDAVIGRDASPPSSAADGNRSAGLGTVSACKLSESISDSRQFRLLLATFGRFLQRKSKHIKTPILTLIQAAWGPKALIWAPTSGAATLWWDPLVNWSLPLWISKAWLSKTKKQRFFDIQIRKSLGSYLLPPSPGTTSACLAANLHPSKTVFALNKH